MILPYALRLLCLSLASFFLVHFAVSLLAIALTPGILRVARSANARTAARVVFVCRLAPTAIAALSVFLLCVPSFLSLEDESGAEFAGFKCLIAAVFAASLFAVSFGRVGRALARSRRYTRKCLRVGKSVLLPGESSPVCVIDESAPFLALAGIIHPAVLMSRRVLETLDAHHVAAALEHERAHSASRDNLKRLCIFAAPGLLPFVHGFDRLEREWSKLTEWAADDCAAAGDAGRSLSLAEALVRMARLGAASQCSPLASSFATRTSDIEERVNRLLGAAPAGDSAATKHPARLAAWSCATLCVVSIAATRPGTLLSVHGLLEHLLH